MTLINLTPAELQGRTDVYAPGEAQAKLDFERVLGITKASLKHKIQVWFDSEESSKALALLSRRGRQYTKEELGFLHLFMLSGHDACVVDNTDEYSAVEVYTAVQNHRRYDAAKSNLEAQI